jgi:hypothetical protein
MRSINPFLRRKRNKTRRSVSVRKIRGVSTMARRRRSHSRRSGGIMGNSTTRSIMAGVALGIADPFLQQIASKLGFGLSDDLAKGVVAIGAKMFLRNPLINSIADAQIALSARSVAQGGFNMFNKPATQSAVSTSGANF